MASDRSEDSQPSLRSLLTAPIIAAAYSEPTTLCLHQGHQVLSSLVHGIGLNEFHRRLMLSCWS